MGEQESKNKAVVRRWNEEVFNKKKFELIDELCDERYSNLTAGIHGREEAKAAAKNYTGDPGLQLSIVDMIAEGDKVAVRIKYSNGREQVSYYTLAKGKIVEDRYYMGPEAK